MLQTGRGSATALPRPLRPPRSGRRSRGRTSASLLRQWCPTSCTLLSVLSAIAHLSHRVRHPR
eukprot:scaffold65923_cov29-Phaeocystis_antarctica.AAC.2